MLAQFVPPLTPRVGGRLVVLPVCRASAGGGSDDAAADQLRTLQVIVTSEFDGAVEWVPTFSSRSGKTFNEAELLQIIQSGRVDVLICTTLDRISRGSFLHRLAATCDMHGVCLIAVESELDTAAPFSATPLAD